MKKDVIYIDIEDDISSVIDKLKNSSEKIIALVPPKGNPVLQSVVNLKLLKRAAEADKKRTVIVTSNQALTQLAGGLDLYVAKTLQSKPTIPSGQPIENMNDETADVSDDVGELENSTLNSVSIDDSSEVELSEEELKSLDEPVKDKKKPVIAGKKGKKTKVPNFDTFRKKLILIGGGVLLLLIVFVLLFGRTSANITVRAETTPVEVSFDATINAAASESDPENFVLKAEKEQIKESISTEFTATGKKDVGNKATGTMTIRRTSVSSVPIDVPEGTRFTNEDIVFISTESTQLAGTSIGPGGIVQDQKTIPVEAEKRGEDYNVSARSYNSSVGGMDANGSEMTGGTSKIITVVSQADFDKARAELAKKDTSEAKEDLKNAFGSSMHVFTDSFTTSLTSVTSSPKVGEEASRAELTAEVVYTMLGVSKKGMNDMLDAFIEQEMPDRAKQRVYENGYDSLRLTKGQANSNQAVYSLATVGQYGPRFDIAKLKKDITGDKVGQARAYLQDLPGVKGIDINLSPFWARQIPNEGKITIKLDVDENASS